GPDGSTPKQYVNQFRGDGKAVQAVKNQTETGSGVGGGLTDAALAAPLLSTLVELLFAPLIVIANLSFIPIEFRVLIGGILAVQAIVALLAAFRGGGIR
ncbi:MAG: hypothetical protein ABEJ07_06270, partial [Candidatus Nanohaloarchaea archaeon]